MLLTGVSWDEPAPKEAHMSLSTNLMTSKWKKINDEYRANILDQFSNNSNKKLAGLSKKIVLLHHDNVGLYKYVDLREEFKG